MFWVKQRTWSFSSHFPVRLPTFPVCLLFYLSLNFDGWQLQSCNDQVSGSFAIDNLKTKLTKIGHLQWLIMMIIIIIPAEWLDNKKKTYDHDLIFRTSCFLCFPQSPISLSIWINIFASFTTLESEGLLRSNKQRWVNPTTQLNLQLRGRSPTSRQESSFGSCIFTIVIADAEIKSAAP